jgi:hypothetical protein
MFLRKMLRSLLLPSHHHRTGRRPRSRGLQLEALEDRCVPSGFSLASGGLLTITGDQYSDQVSLGMSGNGVQATFSSTANGTTTSTTKTYGTGVVTAINVVGASGSMSLTVANTQVLYLLVSPLNFSGGSGVNTLNLQGPSLFNNETEDPTGPAAGSFFFDTRQFPASRASRARSTWRALRPGLRSR